MRLTSKGRRALEVARPLWAQAQGKVLPGLGTKAWTDAQRQLTRLHRVAVKKRQDCASPGGLGASSLAWGPLGQSRPPAKMQSM
jgi:hypothetical protein